MKYWMTKVIMIMVLLFQSSLYAAECEYLQFLKNKSPGTQIVSNDCPVSGGLAVGSQLELVAGARVWLKAFYDKDNDQQLICQNRSQGAVHLNIISTTMPWVQVENIKRCQDWDKNRLNCIITQQQKFFCISGIIKKPLHLAKRQERTTSIVMRSLSIDKQNKNSNDLSYIEKAVNDMQPEIDLCRHLLQAQSPVELIWNVNISGKAVDISILTDGQDEISSCVRDIIASYSYPKPREMLTFVYEF